MKPYRYKRSRDVPEFIVNRLRQRASRKYPDLEFYWDPDNKTFLPVGSKSSGTTYPKSIFTEIVKTSKIKLPREQLAEFRKDQYFDRFKGDFEHIPSAPLPSQKPTKAETSIEKPPSSWPLPGASASFVQSSIPAPPIAPIPKVVPDLKSTAIMPQRGRRRNVQRRRKPRGNPALRAMRRPFKQVVPVQLKSGYFDYEFNIKALIPELLNVYEEVRVTSLSVVFLVKDVTIGSGLYTAILLDQNGYGSALKSTATWFQRVADMPGSLVHHATRGCRLSWKPTEPDARNFVKVIDKADIAKTIARIYIIGQDNTLAIGGVLLVRGRALCRGQYYDASKFALIQRFSALRVAELEEEELARNYGKIGEEVDESKSDCSFPPSDESLMKEEVQ